MTGFSPSAAARPGGLTEPVAGADDVVEPVAGVDDVVDGEVVRVFAAEDGVFAGGELTAGDPVVAEEVEAAVVGDDTGDGAEDRGAADRASVACGTGDCASVDADVDDAVGVVEVVPAVEALLEQPLTLRPTSSTPMAHRRTRLMKRERMV